MKTNKKKKTVLEKMGFKLIKKSRIPSFNKKMIKTIIKQKGDKNE